MPADYVQIGQRLKAHRLGLGLAPEEIAAKLGVSRAALYNYERGSTPVKIDTLERIADILGVSLASLLGAGTEYFANAIGFFERLRQLEEESQQILVYYEPVTFLLTSADYPDLLKKMLIEGLPDRLADRASVIDEIDALMNVLLQRRGALERNKASIAGLIGMTEVRRMLRTGLVGSYKLTAAERQVRVAKACAEIELVAALMEEERLGMQIGAVDDTLPNQTFEICRLRNGISVVAVSPFRLGEFPNVRWGVASITAAPDAVALYEHLVAAIWKRAAKGSAGAALLRQAVKDIRSV
jgi:transcriptional regulator with XRE-family HTH domain